MQLCYLEHMNCVRGAPLPADHIGFEPGHNIAPAFPRRVQEIYPGHFAFRVKPEKFVGNL
jgi:hypothetical protein